MGHPQFKLVQFEPGSTQRVANKLDGRLNAQFTEQLSQVFGKADVVDGVKARLFAAVLANYSPISVTGWSMWQWVNDIQAGVTLHSTVIEIEVSSLG